MHLIVPEAIDICSVKISPSLYETRVRSSMLLDRGDNTVKFWTYRSGGYRYERACGSLTLGHR